MRQVCLFLTVYLAFLCFSGCDDSLFSQFYEKTKTNKIKNKCLPSPLLCFGCKHILNPEILMVSCLPDSPLSKKSHIYQQVYPQSYCSTVRSFLKRKLLLQFSMTLAFIWSIVEKLLQEFQGKIQYKHLFLFLHIT